MLSNPTVHLQNKPRLRQHVNPFRPTLQQLPDPVDWASIYDDPHKPLVVDIGCATGRWLLLLARDSGLDCNWLGLDIRKPVTGGNYICPTMAAMKQCTTSCVAGS